MAGVAQLQTGRVASRFSLPWQRLPGRVTVVPISHSLRELTAMLDDLRARGVKFHSLTEDIDTTTPAGRWPA